MQDILNMPGMNTILESMLQNDPRMQQMAERNPELRQVFSDPSFIRFYYILFIFGIIKKAKTPSKKNNPKLDNIKANGRFY